MPPLAPRRGIPSAGTVTASAAPLTITALNVGQGDATIIQTPSGKTILIDGGPSGAGKSVILPWLRAHHVDHLDQLIATHYDLDHIGGIAEVLHDVPATACLDRGDSSVRTTPAFEMYQKTTLGCHTATPGTKIAFGDGVNISIMMVNGITAAGHSQTLDPDDENAASIVLHIEYGNFQYASMADLPGGGGNPPYDTVDLESLVAPELGDVDVLRTGHHGSHTSTSIGLLDATRPEVAIISTGNGNPFFHPHTAVMNRLLEYGIEIYLTESGHPLSTHPQIHVQNGDVVITSDGITYGLGK